MEKSVSYRKVDVNNINDLNEVKTIFKSDEEDILTYIGNLSNSKIDDMSLVFNEDNKVIGFFTISEPIINQLGLSTVSIINGLKKEYQNQGYGTLLINKLTNEVFLDNVDMIILKINHTNIKSYKVSLKNGFKEIVSDEEDYVMAKFRTLELENKVIGKGR